MRGAERHPAKGESRVAHPGVWFPRAFAHALRCASASFQLLRVSAGDVVKAEPFTVPRKQFELAMLTVELEFVKSRGPGSPPEEVDAPELAKQLQRRFASQVSGSCAGVVRELCGSCGR